MTKITKLAVMAVVVGSINGCRYLDAGLGVSQEEYEPEVRISPVKVGKIEWGDKRLILRYDEGGAPFSPREVLTIRLGERILECECFDGGENETSPYLTLHHKCNDAEWRYVCKVLRECHMEKWSVDYVATGVFDGTSWVLELLRDGKVVKRVHGFNASPDNFKQFYKLKIFAMKHPAAKRSK
jgi:hypothetical protein